MSGPEIIAALSLGGVVGFSCSTWIWNRAAAERSRRKRHCEEELFACESPPSVMNALLMAAFIVATGIAGSCIAIATLVSMHGETTWVADQGFVWWVGSLLRPLAVFACVALGLNFAASKLLVL